MTWISGKTKPLIDLISDKWMQFSELLETPWGKKKIQLPSLLLFTLCFPTGSGEQLNEWSAVAHTAFPVLLSSAMHYLPVFLSVKCPAIKRLRVYHAKNPTSIEAAIVCSTYLLKKKKIMGDENVFFLLQKCAALSQCCRLHTQAACAAPVPIPFSPNAIKPGRVNNWLIIALTRLLNWTRRLEIAALPGTFPLL